MLLTKIFFCRGLLINLPLELQYPYIFYWQRSLPFVEVAEVLKRLFGLKLYWQIHGALTIDKYPGKTFYPSLVLVPKNIDLIVDINKYKRAKRKIKNLLTSKTHKIKMIYLNHQLKTFPSENKLFTFLARNNSVLSY